MIYVGLPPLAVKHERRFAIRGETDIEELREPCHIYELPCARSAPREPNSSAASLAAAGGVYSNKRIRALQAAGAMILRTSQRASTISASQRRVLKRLE